MRRLPFSRVGGCILCAAAVSALLAWSTPAGGQEAAESEPKKSPAAAVQLYGDAASFQNNGAFDLAVEEWTRFLKRYPDDPLAIKARHYLGVCNLQLKQLDKAAAEFAAVLEKQPGFEFAEDAYLNLGWCQYSLAGQGQAELYEKAAATFAASLKKFPQGKYADQANFFRGDSLYYQQKREGAVESYDALVKGFPKSSLRSNGLYALGVTLEELGRHPEAGKAYDTFLAEFDKHELRTEVRMRKAETLLQAGDAATAEEIFAETAAATGFALADHALSRQAFCAAKLEKYDEAAVLYAKIPAQFPKSEFVDEATISAGRCFYRAARHEQAAEWLQKAAAGSGASAVEAAHWLCRIQLSNKDYGQAVAMADKMLPAAGDSPFLVDLKMDKADALYELADRRGEAQSLYLKVAADHPGHALAAQALYNGAFAALELEQFAAGVEHAQAFAEKFADHALAPDARYVEAECQLQLGKLAEAEAIYRKLVGEHPKHAEFDQWRVRLGLSLSMQKKHQDVVEVLGPIVGELADATRRAEAQYLVGASQFSLKQFDAAAKALQASQASSSEWAQADEALLLLGRALGELKRADEAIAVLTKLSSDHPQSSRLDNAFYRVGELQYAQDKFPEAVAAYGQVTGKWPQSSFAPFAFYGAGWSHLKAKQYADAAKNFSALLDNHADHQLAAEATFSRAMARRQQGQHAEAIADVNAFLKTEPAQQRKSSALYERGLAEAALKQYAQAEQSFAAILADDAEYAGADKVLYELAWAHKLQDQQEKAVGVFARLTEQHPDSSLAAEAHFHVGESHYDSQEYEAAIAAHSSAKQKAGRGELGEKASYKLGWSYYQARQYDQALEQFQDQVQTYSSGGLFADGSFMKAECLFKLDKFAAALPVYTSLRAQKLSSPQAEALVLLHGGQSAAQEKNWRQSQEFLTPIFEKFPESPYLAEARYELAWARQNLGEADAALKDYETASEMSRDHVGARARFMMGEIYFERKNYEEAVKQFQRVIFGFGGDKAPDEVKKWQAMSGYEAGRCAEVQIEGAEDDEPRRAKLIADAKKFYGEVAEKHPESKVAVQAKQRLAVLDKL